ncbi:unnamed protein product [Somion occarium]|uniref:Uncharacterized protein n=1 Tax=Somion occarium TaxID=3059160 RepID=A0ABP1CRV2_9APHY
MQSIPQERSRCLLDIYKSSSTQPNFVCILLPHTHIQYSLYLSRFRLAMNRRSGVYHRNDILYLKVAKPPLAKGAQVFVSGVYSGGIQRHAPNTSIAFKVNPEDIDIPGVDYKKRYYTSRSTGTLKTAREFRYQKEGEDESSRINLPPGTPIVIGRRDSEPTLTGQRHPTRPSEAIYEVKAQVQYYVPVMITLAGLVLHEELSVTPVVSRTKCDSVYYVSPYPVYK